MGRMVKAMMGSTRQYFDAVCALGAEPKMSAARFAKDSVTKDSVTKDSAKDQDLDRDYRYRLTRKNVHIAFANLGNAFQRMMMEPKAQQRYVPELNELLVQSHALASQITAAAPLVAALATPAHAQFLEPLQRALSVVRDNLHLAENADAPPQPAPGQTPGALTQIIKTVTAGSTIPAAEALARSRELNRELDEIVLSAESQSSVPAEAVQELKLLVHQCKQMIGASWLIRNDACTIQASLS